MKGGNHMADEYIKREDALEAFTFHTAYTAHEIEHSIKRIPAADVAPVVRCKDCASWNGNPATGYGVCDRIADRDREGGASFDDETAFDDFCNYGARKEPTNEPRA